MSPSSHLRPLLWGALTILLLGGLYWAFKASMGGHEPTAAHTLVFHLSVSAPRPGEESPVFKAMQGDTVVFIIRSDRPGEVHIHIYEKKIALKPGSDVILTFTANSAGLFPVHLHDPDGSMRHLGLLEVQPK
jgi:hypothetical protein